MGIVKRTTLSNNPDAIEVRKWREAITTLNTYQTYAGSPVGNVTPRWIHDLCLDTVDSSFYWSTGLTTADWEGGVGGVGSAVMVNNSVGDPNCSNVSIELAATLTYNTWESIGPTGSGADHVWTAMDLVPTTAEWIRIRTYAHCEDGGASTDLFAIVYARLNGTSIGFDESNRILYLRDYSTAAGQGSAGGVFESTIPLSAGNLFDLAWADTFTTNHFECFLIGWGANS